MQDPSQHLAKTLKEYRKDKGLSLDATAQKTGVSKAMLGQIERGESSPTIQTLWKITTGLGISLSTFIEPKPTRSLQTTIIRDADDIRQHPANAGMLIAPLFPYEEQLKFEHFELIFKTAYERISEPHADGVIEFLTVIDGKMDIFCDGKWHPVAKGQTIRYAGDRPHGFRNPYDQDVKTLLVIHYPNGR